MQNDKTELRVDAIDVARGIALAAMASYHFSWDLELFGYLNPGTVNSGFLRLYARVIAASFLFIVGFSLVLATQGGVEWRRYFTRLLQVGLVAALISIVTFFAIPDSWIFFGILHHIVLASLIGLIFVKLHWAVAFLAGIFAFVLPNLASSTISSPWLIFIGLFEVSPSSNDFVPLFPWLSASLFGIATAKQLLAKNWLPLVAGPKADGFPARQLKFLGKNSLIFYIVHQPVLIFLVWLFSQIAPADQKTAAETFKQECTAICLEQFGTVQCETYCNCFENELNNNAADWTQFAANDKSKKISEICSRKM